MSDDDTTTTSTAPSEGEKLLRKFDELFHGHKEATKDEVIKMRRDIEKLLNDTAEESRRTVKELESRAQSLEEWVEGEKKARAERDKVESNTTTIVVPPNDVTPPQPQGEPEGEQSFNPTDDGKKKGGWRKFW